MSDQQITDESGVPHVQVPEDVAEEIGAALYGEIAGACNSFLMGRKGDEDGEDFKMQSEAVDALREAIALTDALDDGAAIAADRLVRPARQAAMYAAEMLGDGETRDGSAAWVRKLDAFASNVAKITLRPAPAPAGEES